MLTYQKTKKVTFWDISDIMFVYNSGRDHDKYSTAKSL